MRQLLLLLAIMVISLGAMAFDVGVVTGGDLMIYYKDGNSIVVKNCGSDYSDIKKRSDCQTVEQENRVPIASFKRALQSQFQITANEVKSDTDNQTNNQASLSQRKKELESKLARIKAFADNPQIGCDSQCKRDQADAQSSLNIITKELATTQKGQAASQASLDKVNAAVQKMNAAINDLVDKKISSPDLTMVSAVSDKASYKLLKQFDASQAECGTDEILNRKSNPNNPGNSNRTSWLKELMISSAFASVVHGIGEKMEDCKNNVSGSEVVYHNQKTGQDVIWKLVSRKRDSTTGKFYEVWQDSHASPPVLWSDTLDKTSELNSAEAKCNDPDGRRAVAGVTDKKFTLPTKEDFEQAREDGITVSLPNMSDRIYWSSSVGGGGAWAFSIYDGDSGYYQPGPRDYDYDGLVRCVSR